MAALDLQDNGWLTVPWAEYISRNGATSDGASSFEGGNQQTLSILVNFEDTLQAELDLLGSNFYDRASGNLVRYLPARHPRWTWLYASRVTGRRPVQFLDKEETALPDGQLVSASAYNWHLLTVLFTQPKWAMLSDADLDAAFGSPRQEWQRFISLVPQPMTESIVRDQGAFKWAEGSGSGGQPTSGNQFPGVMYQYLNKCDYLLQWHRVPYYGLVSSTTGRPENLLAGLNSVNSASFLSFPAGTLLFKGFRFTLLEAPHQPDFFGAIPHWMPSLCVDVEMGFQFFDPPHANSSYRGHNLAPWTDGQWYKVVDAQNGTQTIYPASDFTQLFRLPG